MSSFTARLSPQPVETVRSISAPPPRAGAGGMRRRWRQSAAWYVMLVPSLLLVAALVGYPFIRTVLLGFEEVGIGGSEGYVGLENYQRMITDSAFWASIKTTFIFAFASVFLQLALAWSLALLLWNKFRRMSNVLRIAFAIPMLLSPVAVGVVWRVLLNPQYGWISAFSWVRDLDLLGTPQSALVTMIFVEVWHWTPFVFLIVAAGLNAIPEDVLEAARIDGAGPILMFTKIIWPLALPVTAVAFLLRTLDALKIFDLPYNLTQGGPGTATKTVAMYLYEQGFTVFNQGYAAALSFGTTVIMGVTALLILWYMRRAERKIS